MKKASASLRKTQILFALSVVFCALLIFAAARARQQPRNDLHIAIHPPTLHFLHPDSLRNGLMKHAAARGKGASAAINLQRIEEYLYHLSFVEKVEARRNQMGDIHVEIWQKQPIARLLQFDKNDMYITQKGELIPVHAQQAPRVMTLMIAFEISPQQQHKLIKERLPLLQFIHSSPFWRAQIAGMVMEKENQILLYPQVTHQRIRMRAHPKRMARTFQSLYAFYTQGLAKKGWTSYREIDMRFENQIVCR